MQIKYYHIVINMSGFIPFTPNRRTYTLPNITPQELKENQDYRESRKNEGFQHYPALSKENTRSRTLSLHSFPETTMRFYKFKEIPEKIRKRMKQLFRYYLPIYNKLYEYDNSDSLGAGIKHAKIIQAILLVWSFMKLKEQEIKDALGDFIVTSESNDSIEENLDIIIIANILLIVSHVHTSYKKSSGDVWYETDSGVFSERYFKKFKPDVDIGIKNHRTPIFDAFRKKVDSMILLFLNSGIVGHFTRHGGATGKTKKNRKRKLLTRKCQRK